MKTLFRAVLAASFALTVGCEGSTDEVLVERAPELGSCSPQPEVDLCSEIPRFDGEQLVHGLAEPFELCELPPMTFRANDAAWTLHPELEFPERVILRVGWSVGGLHLYARVFDPRLVVSADDDRLYEGDSIELYTAATDELLGPIDGLPDAAPRRMVIAPPDGGLLPRARIHYQPRPGIEETVVLTSSSDFLTITNNFAAMQTDGGYVVEAKLAWSAGGRVPSSGDRIGFDFALNIADTDTAKGLEQQAVLGYVLPSDTECVVEPPNVGPRPSCDNRTWCTPILE